MPIPRFLKNRVAKEEAVLIGDHRVEGWESVSTFEDQQTAVAWRDQLRSLGVDASCVADHPLDRFGRGDIYLMVPPEQWSRANEIVVAVVVTDSGRPLPRIGGLQANEIKGEDGLR